MNQLLKKLNPEDILFFDIRIQKREEPLENPTTKFLFQYKHREESEIENLYEKQGLTLMGFNKVTEIAVAYIKGGDMYYKVITGIEADIIKQFCEIANKFRVLSGVNVIGYKLPLLHVNGSRHFDMTEILNDNFNVSGKKPWDIKFVIDITEQFKGTYFISPNLYDMCYHFNIPFGMDLGIESDIISTVKLFTRMQGSEFSGNIFNKTDVKDTRNLFEKVYDLGLHSTLTNELTEYVKEAKKSKLVEEAKQLLFMTYVRNNFANKDEDSKKVREQKLKEVEELFND